MGFNERDCPRRIQFIPPPTILRIQSLLALFEHPPIGKGKRRKEISQ